MFNIQEIQDCLLALVGWKNSLNTCENPIDPALSTSETGQYYNNTHALLRLDNLQAIAPSKNDYNYPTYNGATSYDTDDIVILVGLYYQSLTDANVGNDPATDFVNWKQIFPFSIWLEEQTKESINNLFNSVFVSKKINQQSKSLLADSTIYNAGARTNFEITQARFVGYALALGDYKNLKLTIDKIGLRFTDNVVDLPIYIYHSSQTEPIKEITITTTRTSNFVWEKLSEPIILEYWNDLINTGGYFYVGYYEEDLPIGVKAINDTYDAFKGPCGSCPAHRKAKQSWDRYARFAQFYPLEIPNSALDPDVNPQIFETVVQIIYDVIYSDNEINLKSISQNGEAPYIIDASGEFIRFVNPRYVHYGAGIYDQLQDLVNDTQSDMTKFVEGNASAGTRVRKAMQAIKGLAQELRVEVQNQKNSEF